jgi:hypothetical protein
MICYTRIFPFLFLWFIRRIISLIFLTQWAWTYFQSLNAEKSWFSTMLCRTSCARCNPYKIIFHLICKISQHSGYLELPFLHLHLFILPLLIGPGHPSAIYRLLEAGEKRVNGQAETVKLLINRYKIHLSGRNKFW